jgi:hypothetical protein
VALNTITPNPSPFKLHNDDCLEYILIFYVFQGPYEKQKHTHVEDLNERQILYEYWARWGKWFKYQRFVLYEQSDWSKKVITCIYHFI